MGQLFIQAFIAIVQGPQPLLARHNRGSSMAEQPCLWAVCLVRIQALGKTDVI